jgi:hypothetical protein
MIGCDAYLIGDDGHISNRVTILAADDGEAVRLDGHAVELWQEGRKIATFDREE